YGSEYLRPLPFDPRLNTPGPTAVAKAAKETGVAQRPIIDVDSYVHELTVRLDPTAAWLGFIVERVRREPKRVVFAEGEESKVVRAAIAFRDQGLGTPILLGREDIVRSQMKDVGLEDETGIEIINQRTSDAAPDYADALYAKLQRRGYLARDCTRMVFNDRNIFAASMVSTGDADALITGVTRSYSVALGDVRRVIDDAPGKRAMGMSMVVARGRTVLVADTNVHDMPTAQELADIAIESADVARRLGYEPRVALLAYSTFGHPMGERSERVREAVEILDQQQRDFEYDGEMSADVALNREAMSMYPFCRLTEPANVLVMPAIHSASISTKMLSELGGASIIGPLLVGLEKSVQIAPMGAAVSDLVNLAAIAAYGLDT
ncbi:MAG: phosphate acyltransferase, partial [Candidatus Phaeomarinobacter sp.]